MRHPDQKPTAEFAERLLDASVLYKDGSIAKLYSVAEELIATRDLAVEAAAYRRIIIEADKALKARGVGGLVRGPLRDRMNALITPSHTVALAVHDRERGEEMYGLGPCGEHPKMFWREPYMVKPYCELCLQWSERQDVLLKKFEELAGKLRKNGDKSAIAIRRQACFECADELHSQIEQIRKERL